MKHIVYCICLKTEELVCYHEKGFTKGMIIQSGTR